MSTPIKNVTRRSGFTLVETVLAVGITALAVITMLSLLPLGLETLRESSGRAADSRILQALAGRYEMQDWVSVEAQETSGEPREFYFDQAGVPVEKNDTNQIYTARVQILPPPIVPGAAVANPFLRRLAIVVSDRPPEAGDPFDPEYETRSHSVLIAKIDK